MLHFISKIFNMRLPTRFVAQNDTWHVLVSNCWFQLHLCIRFSFPFRFQLHLRRFFSFPCKPPHPLCLFTSFLLSQNTPVLQERWKPTCYQKPALQSYNPGFKKPNIKLSRRLWRGKLVPSPLLMGVVPPRRYLLPRLKRSLSARSQKQETAPWIWRVKLLMKARSNSVRSSPTLGFSPWNIMKRSLPICLDITHWKQTPLSVCESVELSSTRPTGGEAAQVQSLHMRPTGCKLGGRDGELLYPGEEFLNQHENDSCCRPT